METKFDALAAHHGCAAHDGVDVVEDEFADRASRVLLRHLRPNEDFFANKDAEAVLEVKLSAESS